MNAQRIEGKALEYVLVAPAGVGAPFGLRLLNGELPWRAVGQMPGGGAAGDFLAAVETSSKISHGIT